MNPTRLVATAAFVFLMGGVSASGQTDGGKFLSSMGPQLEAARYSQANEEFAWVGWIGARVDLYEKGKWTAFFNPNVQTILGHRVRSFEAVQANYSLELGVRRQVGRGQVTPFFHHVSRHVQDRDKIQAIDWNFAGVRYESPWPERWHRGGAFGASTAVATLSSGVRYNLEGRLSGDIDLVRKGNRAAFLLADVRIVRAEPSPNFDRKRVTDFRAELGFRFWKERSQFALFAAYEHRGDALIPQALVTSRGLFGFRIRGQKDATPAIVPLP
ncbi:MAG: hypothetical protein ABI672_01500 [Vicinamibacteria bacterium]